MGRHPQKPVAIIPAGRGGAVSQNPKPEAIPTATQLRLRTLRLTARSSRQECAGLAGTSRIACLLRTSSTPRPASPATEKDWDRPVPTVRSPSERSRTNQFSVTHFYSCFHEPTHIPATPVEHIQQPECSGVGGERCGSPPELSAQVGAQGEREPECSRSLLPRCREGCKGRQFQFRAPAAAPVAPQRPTKAVPPNQLAARRVANPEAQTEALRHPGMRFGRQGASSLRPMPR